MNSFESLTLIVNGVILAVSLVFLLISIWYDLSKPVIQQFALMLGLVFVWNLGSLIIFSAAFVGAGTTFFQFGAHLMEIGFLGSSLSIYALTATLASVQTRRFGMLSLVGILVIVLNQILFSGASNGTKPSPSFLTYLPVPSVVLYAIFGAGTVFILWRFHRKFRPRHLVLSLGLFVIGQAIIYINPALSSASLALLVCSVASFSISTTLVHREIISPLRERMRYLRSMHQVSLAIASQIDLGNLLQEIARQACSWVSAQGACVFLKSSDTELKATAVHNLPMHYLGQTIQLGSGIVGITANRKHLLHVENYNRDWKHDPLNDLPLAKETFGSLIAVPLLTREEVIGVLLVISGNNGRILYREDAELLSFLAAEASIAISHSHLFQRLSATSSNLERLLNSVENPVVTVTQSGQVTYQNDAANRLLHGVGEAVEQLLPATWTEHAKDEKRETKEIIVGKKTFHYQVSPLSGAISPEWLIVYNDVSRLKEMNELKSELIRITSHDLKNPLQAVLANLEMLQEDLRQNPDPEVALSIKEMKQQINRMTEITSGILEMERLNEASHAKAMHSIKDIADRAIEETRSFAASQGQTILYQGIPSNVFIFCQRDHLQRALVNLLENAVKYSPREARTYIEIVEHDSSVEICVSDEGIGVPELFRERIFDRFFRANSFSTDKQSVPGTGIGLSIVKSIVESHRGKVWVVPNRSQGSTFHILLPIGRNEEAQHEIEKPALGNFDQPVRHPNPDAPLGSYGISS